MNAKGHIVTGGICLGVVQYATGFIPTNYVYPAWAVPFVGWLPYGVLPLVVTCLAVTIGALLPDIDHPQATISQKANIAKGMGPLGVLGYLGGIFRAVLGGHRGFTHTLACASLPGVLFRWLPAAYDYILIAFMVGYVSHLLADMLTEQGIPLFWPFTSRRIGL